METLVELNKLTKAQLIAKLLEGQTEEKVETEYFPNGELKRQIRRLYDAATGKLLQLRICTWTYHPNGVVNEIEQTAFDGNMKQLSGKVVRHASDGNGIIVTEAKIGKLL